MGKNGRRCCVGLVTSTVRPCLTSDNVRFIEGGHRLATTGTVTRSGTKGCSLRLTLRSGTATTKGNAIEKVRTCCCPSDITNGHFTSVLIRGFGVVCPLPGGMGAIPAASLNRITEIHTPNILVRVNCRSGPRSTR